MENKVGSHKKYHTDSEKEIVEGGYGKPVDQYNGNKDKRNVFPYFTSDQQLVSCGNDKKKS